MDFTSNQSGGFRLRPEWKSKFKKMEDGFITAQILALNAQALSAGALARKEIRSGVFPNLKHKKFVLRNKWIINSIIPVFGKKFGLIPSYKKNLKTAVARAGSTNPQMRDQEGGFSKHNPQVPTEKARASSDYRKPIGRHARLDVLKSGPVINPKNMRKRGKKKYKTRAEAMRHMVAMLAREKYKGVIEITDELGISPPGLYRMQRGGVLRLKLLRLSQRGYKYRQPTRWFRRSLSKTKLFEQYGQMQFNKQCAFFFQSIR